MSLIKSSSWIRLASGLDLPSSNQFSASSNQPPVAAPMLHRVQAPLLRLARSSRAIHSSAMRMMPEHIVKVPSMGDSISEGTVVDLKKQIGQHVEIDEVVMVLETDKVSVDVMSPVAGTLVKQFVELDQDVEVGRDLFVIDGDVKATVAASAPTPAAAPAATPAPVATPVAAPAATHHHDGARVPRIKFLGKRSLLAHPAPAAKSAAPSTLVVAPSSSADVLPFGNLPSQFARKPISKKEIHAINTAASFL
ncbi:hypothetical protein SDRG_03703 [Saprolegnia diclina VS20]|uniref:Lipoyl-binding domain-containing protein n=1 Tax=Saprolegnia diclina (strain VS20) TaxID=1156394 RepID=T0QKZ3_SAPDV|nr:hypothetical protein SDRG_03703 [Saprolegnia diclina VS20]EQC38739.1 hypothetical protein SDRG_03703 [Saprolegnia diclina VS20]|eukprot:XP_008607563.1 hypothetical protein SDRG_03703 [Saprolegnia diclina VS20]